MNDGSASSYDVVVRVADRVNAKYYPMLLPVLCPTAEQRPDWLAQDHIKPIFDRAKTAGATFVGVGNIGPTSPIFVDGFVSKTDVDDLLHKGGTGEMLSWIFDKNGKMIDCDINRRVTSVELSPEPEKPVIAMAAGAMKVEAIMGAMRSRLITKLITNEYTAELILSSD